MHAVLRDAGLDRFYELRGAAVGLPVGEDGGTDRGWLDPLEAELGATTGLWRLAMDVQGIHCTACVWLIEQLFARHAGGARCVVNPSRGRLELVVGPAFPLRTFVAEVEELGYRLGPALKERSMAADDLSVRLGLSAALAMNTTLFAVAQYLGLEEGPLYDLFRQLAFAMAAATVAIGGWPFFRSAWRALRRGLLHLDLPIAVGILLAFGGSAWSFATDAGEGSYGDSLAVFVALMLGGRWLRERVVAQNRARLLASDGVDGLWTRRLFRGGRVERVRCRAVEEGDELLLAPGDLLPVAGRLCSARGAFRLDWIDGESEPRVVRRDGAIPAGAFNAGGEALRVRAAEPFSTSTLLDLLSASTEREAGGGRFWDRLSRVYVVGVLVAAAGAFVLWWGLTGDPSRAVAVTTAVLVVTCPCAFGIATPLAYELAQAGLRRVGLFVRHETLLDRAAAVRQVVLDKTGTLTTGRPRLRDAAPLAGLTDAERALLADLALRSTHPKSAAIVDALAGEERLDTSLPVHEAAGAGLQTFAEGALWRLGRPDWAAPEATVEPEVDLVLARNGRPLACFVTEEALRPDSRAELERLAARGLDLRILSGDDPAKVHRVAAALGVPDDRAVGGCSPGDKARWLRAHDPEHTLFVGDGINDSLVAEVAHVSGTPAIDRPFMPAKTDFYFVTAGLAPIRHLLDTAVRLRVVVRRILAFAIVYNAVALVLAYLGLVEPWVAAVLMPLSSLSTIGFTVAVLARSRSWKS